MTAEGKARFEAEANVTEEAQNMRLLPVEVLLNVAVEKENFGQVDRLHSTLDEKARLSVPSAMYKSLSRIDPLSLNKAFGIVG